ncbi:MAG TPA: TraR/DksA C4-type zinc finger protein [Actinomycetota bacterium]|jgi:DnaK suppressor protein
MERTDLDRLRAALQEQRAQARREIEELGADPSADEVVFVGDAGFSDRSHSTEERSRLIALVESHRANLRDVEAALERMEAGTYGICLRCGKPISDERLEALPWAALCIECKQKGLSA